MRLADHEARARLESHDHGILCTVHAERGVDAVPVAYAVDDDGYVGVPIDRVKPKASLRLQRERNLEADPRATLLVEHWDRSDWSRLWWVRAELRWQGATRNTRTSPLLGYWYCTSSAWPAGPPTTVDPGPVGAKPKNIELVSSPRVPGLALAVRPEGRQRSPALKGGSRRSFLRSGLKRSSGAPDAGGANPDNARRSTPVAVTFLPAIGAPGARLTAWSCC